MARAFYCLGAATILLTTALTAVYLLDTDESSNPQPPVDGQGHGRSPGAADEKTLVYLQRLDLKRFERRGTNYPMSLAKLKPPESIYDYDFDRLSQVEERLRGVSRLRVLQQIFDLVTSEARTNQERHLAVLRFLHKASYHNPGHLPVYADKSMVFDPLVLLELTEMHCGQVARVSVDLFESRGYQGRLVQLGGHVVAEIYYNGAWHYLDADVFGGGETVQSHEVGIPSVSELSTDPYVVDALTGYGETAVYATHKDHIVQRTTYYPSYFFFSGQAYPASSGPLYYVKSEEVHEDEYSVRVFGWNHYRTIDASDIVLDDFPPFFQPSAPAIKSITIDGKSALIEWYPSRDDDHDLKGYRVFVSSRSRGWNYRVFAGDDRADKYWSARGKWQSAMYDRVFEIPPHDLALIETQETAVTVELPEDGAVYLSVMPFDEHGESVGKRVYFTSAEVILSDSSSADAPAESESAARREH